MSSVKIERDEKRWEVTVRAEIAPEILERHFVDALKHAQKEARIPGFRPGHAPAGEVLRTQGEHAILEKAAELAIREELPNILAKENLPAVDTPHVTVEEIARGKTLKLHARAPLSPRVNLPDYKNIAKNEPRTDAAVSDEEVKQALAHFRRERARVTKVELGTSPKEAAEQAHAMEEKDLPELDDAFAQTIGYENAKKFSESVATHLKAEKERHEVEKRRAAILEELVKKADISYPALFREYELDDMEARLQSDLKRMHSTFDAYLAQNKKTREELRGEWSDIADKRAKIRLILSAIAHKENVVPDKEALEKNIERANAMYPDVNPETLRANITHALQNEVVLNFLEEQK